METSAQPSTIEWAIRIVIHQDDPTLDLPNIARDTTDIATIHIYNAETKRTYRAQVPYLSKKEHPIYGSKYGIFMLETLIDSKDYIVTQTQSANGEYVVSLSFNTYIGACGQQLRDNITFIAH